MRQRQETFLSRRCTKSWNGASRDGVAVAAFGLGATHGGKSACSVRPNSESDMFSYGTYLAHHITQFHA